MRVRWTALAALALLGGCDALKADTSTLWSTSSTPPDRPRCDACHGFAPRTGAHRFHLDSNRTVGARHTTCMDCHAASIAFSKTTIVDTTFWDSDPDLPWHSASFPWRSFDRSKWSGPDANIEINTLDSLPLAWAERESGAENPFWITADAKGPGLPGHANGHVDVVFAERNNFTDTNGIVHRASWDPVRLSCNAVACHNADAMNSSKYVWKDVVR